MKRVALILILLAVSSSPAHAAKSQCNQIKIDARVTKGISLPCLDGMSTKVVQSIRGPIVVNVWGSWCDPCKEELPYFVHVAATKKIAIAGIDVEEKSMAAGRKFASAQNITWPNLYDVASKTRGLFGMGVPVTWFIDAKGAVKFKQIGVIHSQKILNDLIKIHLGITV